MKAQGGKKGTNGCEGYKQEQRSILGGNSYKRQKHAQMLRMDANRHEG